MSFEDFQTKEAYTSEIQKRVREARSARNAKIRKLTSLGTRKARIIQSCFFQIILVVLAISLAAQFQGSSSYKYKKLMREQLEMVSFESEGMVKTFQEISFLEDVGNFIQQFSVNLILDQLSEEKIEFIEDQSTSLWDEIYNGGFYSYYYYGYYSEKFLESGLHYVSYSDWILEDSNDMSEESASSSSEGSEKDTETSQKTQEETLELEIDADENFWKSWEVSLLTEEQVSCPLKCNLNYKICLNPFFQYNDNSMADDFKDIGGQNPLATEFPFRLTFFKDLSSIFELKMPDGQRSAFLYERGETSNMDDIWEDPKTHREEYIQMDDILLQHKPEGDETTSNSFGGFSLYVHPSFYGIEQIAEFIHQSSFHMDVNPGFPSHFDHSFASRLTRDFIGALCFS